MQTCSGNARRSPIESRPRYKRAYLPGPGVRVDADIVAGSSIGGMDMGSCPDSEGIFFFFF